MGHAASAADGGRKKRKTRLVPRILRFQNWVPDYALPVFSFSRCSRSTALRLSLILLPSVARTFTRI